MVADAVKKFGSIDILVNNAGFGGMNYFWEMPVEEWDTVLNTNLRGAFFCAKEAVKVMLEKGSYDIYQPDATMGGGIGDAMKVLEACREQGLGYTPHTWTNGLGFLINLQVYAAGPRDHPIEYPYEPPSWIPEARDGLLTEPIRVAADGTVAIPDTPGLGIELDDDKLAHYGDKYFEITSRGIAVKTVREKGLFAAVRLARKRRR